MGKVKKSLKEIAKSIEELYTLAGNDMPRAHALLIVEASKIFLNKEVETLKEKNVRTQ